MVKLQILEKKKFNKYVLYDSISETKISLLLEFHQMEEPNVGDTLFLHESMLDRNSEYFVQPYAFKPFVEKDSRIFYLPDYAFILVDGKGIILIRLYG